MNQVVSIQHAKPSLALKKHPPGPNAPFLHLPPHLHTPAPPLPTPAQLGEKLMLEFDRSWQNAQTETEKRIRALNPEARRLIQLQNTVQHLGLGAQLLTQAAEAVNGTIRRVQQLGGS